MKTNPQETPCCPASSRTPPACAVPCAPPGSVAWRACVPPGTHLAGSVVSLLCLVVLAGCTTPDLTPFADAGKAVSTGVNTAGDLAIKPLTHMALWDSKSNKYVEPDDPSHPAKKLQESWELRRRAMDAVLVYSASLAEISQASARRKQNAAELVDSVKQLASAVPGITAVPTAAGDLVVTVASAGIEVKAWHDMGKAVRAADPAIQLVATMLKKDFAGLSKLFQDQRKADLLHVVLDLRPVENVYGKLLEQRENLRKAVAKDPCDLSKGGDLARLDTLMAGVEQDRNRRLSEKAQIQASLADGQAVFAAADAALDAWASAHKGLVKSLEQNRAPNLALLVARAEELKAIVDRIRK